MIAPRFIPLVLRQVLRHPTRSVLTIGGVAVGMFLFVTVQALQRGVTEATSVTAADTTLVVYRANRFCPSTSRLPEAYQSRIERAARRAGGAGAAVSVVPMAIVVNHCGASLDVVTFRGIRPEDVERLSQRWRLREGSIDEWLARSDAALVGERLATRRRLKVGDSFDSAGVTVTVAGIFEAEEPQHQNVAYVHLPFLQRAATRDGTGTVTQYSVTVPDPARLLRVAAAIDEEFRADAEPTTTRPERAFVAQAAASIIEIVRFTRWLGWACLGAVLALVASAVAMSVHDRVREHAVFQTLGFRPMAVTRLIVVEGALLGAMGGVLGTLIALAVVALGRFTLSNEGVSIVIRPDLSTFALGVAISILVGAAAGVIPAWRAGRRDIVACFRAV